MPRIAPLLKLTRFPLVFTAIADSATAYLLAIGGRPPDPATLGVLALASACLYACGMVLNDVADADVDRERHPERPIPSGQVSVRAARTFGMTLSVVGVAAAAAIQVPLGVAAMVTWIVILVYDFGLKEKGPAGAVAMAAARFCNFGMGIVAAGESGGWMTTLPPGPWMDAAVLAIYVFFLTRISQAEEALYPGWAVAMGLVPLLGTLSFGWTRGKFPFPWTALLAGSLTLLLLVLGLQAGQRKTKESIMRLVLWSVIGIIVLDASFLLSRGLTEQGAWIAALLVPVLISRPVFRHL